ncbi:general substrate transporter [Sporodiniella umbellata]|nr:general substrate transporter [Sporodiniella umbellata]
MTGVVLMPSFKRDMAFVDDNTNGLLISALLAGAVVGAIISGPLADTVGRKALMSLGTITFIFGNVLQVGAGNLNTLYGGRGITGISMGMLSMAVPLFQSEMAPKNVRGRLMSLQQFTTTLGIATSYWMDYVFVNMDKSSEDDQSIDTAGSTGWRLAIGLQLIPALFLLIGLILIIPESPRHSIDKKHTTEALYTLAKLRGDGTTTHTDVLMEFVEMRQNITFEHKIFKQNKYKRLFQSGHENNRRRLVFGMAVQIFQQLTGVNAILVFTPQIFRAAGLSGRDITLFANALSGSINLLATIPAIFFIDKWGRRPTMIIGAMLCCVCLMVMAILSGLHGFGYTEETVESSSLLTRRAPMFVLFDTNAPTVGFLVVTYCYVAFYACTWGTLGWVVPAELYSQGVRAKALGISTASNWLATYAILQLTPIMLVKIRWGTYLFFCVMCLLIAITIHLYFPETNGKSLEEIDLIFNCRFNYYDVNVHHPQTAAEALEQMEKVQQMDKNVYRFPFTPERTFHQTRKPTLLSQHHQPSYVVKFPQNIYQR